MVGVGEGAESASTRASSKQRSKEISEGGKDDNILLQRPDEEDNGTDATTRWCVV